MGRVEHFSQIAAAENVRLITFPEMCLTGYWHVRHLSHKEVEALAEPVPDGPTTQHLRQLSRHHNLLIGAGLIEKAGDGRLFNTYVLCDADGTVHFHRKIHCFISEYMDSGDSYTVFNSSLGYKIGILSSVTTTTSMKMSASRPLRVRTYFSPLTKQGDAAPKPLTHSGQSIWICGAIGTAILKR